MQPSFARAGSAGKLIVTNYQQVLPAVCSAVTHLFESGRASAELIGTTWQRQDHFARLQALAQVSSLKMLLERLHTLFVDLTLTETQLSESDLSI